MYAKLTAGVGIHASNMIRDIVRLCTSQSPSTSLLGAFNSATSVIIDDTPAGWTYVYSNIDTGTLAGTGATASAGYEDWWAMSAPCLGPTETTVKYAKFTTGSPAGTTVDETNDAGFTLNTAYSISGLTILNETYRTAVSSATYDDFADGILHDLRGTGTYHVVANPRRITIVKEQMGWMGVWETSIPEVYEFAGTTPVISIYNSLYGNSASATGVPDGWGGTPAGTLPSASGENILTNQPPIVTTSTNYHMVPHASLVHQYDPNTVTVYGTVLLNPTLQSTSGTHWPYLFASHAPRRSAVASNGQLKHIVTPIFFSAPAMGLPTVSVTGVSDIYMVKGTIGSTGDIVTINNIDYTFFACSHPTALSNVESNAIGLLMLTS